MNGTVFVFALLLCRRSLLKHDACMPDCRSMLNALPIGQPTVEVDQSQAFISFFVFFSLKQAAAVTVS
jgi:hypothetical protein